MVSRIKERLLQYKQELQKQTMYKEGLPGSSLDIVNSLLDDLEEDEKENGWIPVGERMPDPDKHILVSFFNFSLPMIGRYTVDDGVEWGAHQDWAQNYMNEKFPEEAMDGDIDLQTKCNVGLIGAGDWLVERGWVLLHNPSQGIAYPTKNSVREYTKAQKEFLYDYYMERGCKEEANAIWKERAKR